MDEGSAVFEGTFAVDHRRHRLVVDFDELDGVAGDIAVFGDDDGHRLALVPGDFGSHGPAAPDLHVLLDARDG